MNQARLILGLLGVFLCIQPMHAELRRFAIVVGSNAGSNALPDLRFAEDDARKIATTLVELGDVKTANLRLLEGATSRQVAAAFAQVSSEIKNLSKQNDKALLLFYFSGHSDGMAMELGRERLLFSDLRRMLRDTQADIRLAVVDSCKSGALLAAKGGREGPAFQIRLLDELAASGEVIVTSSAANEIALESRELGGSVFTHHLVSGLRGAADASRDGIVTLNEAYEYAYGKTLSFSGSTLVGSQHPGYDYRVSGQGELALTRLDKATAVLRFPEGFERGLILNAKHRVVAELSNGAMSGLALPEGTYDLRIWRDQKLWRGNVKLSRNQQLQVGWHMLRPETVLVASLKGSSDGFIVGERRAPSSRPWAPHYILVAGGVKQPVADGIDASLDLNLSLGQSVSSGWQIAFEIMTGQGSGFRETSWSGSGGWRWGKSVGALRPWIQADVLAGVVRQSADMDSSRMSAFAGVGGRSGVAINVVESWIVNLQVDSHASWLRQENSGALWWSSGVLAGVGATW